jgi:hypothetical protein
MSKLFNATSTGTFSDNLTFTRPLTSALGVFEGGTKSKSVTIDTPAGTIVTEPLSLKGVFLNIDYVYKDATSIFTISLKGALGITHTYTYYVSSLYKEFNKRIGTTVSEYWQGFDLLNLDISWTPQLEVNFFCSSEQDLKLVGDEGTNFNHYFIPSTTTDFLTATTTPEIRIGSYLTPISSTDINGSYNHSGELSLVRIVNDTATTNTTDIVVWNQATLILQSNTETINQGGEGVMITPGATLSAAPGSILTLQGGQPLLGLNNSVISISGTNKLPYSFLDIDYPASTLVYTTTDNVSSWNTKDSILFTGNSAINTSESNTIVSTNANSFTVSVASLHDHLSISTSTSVFGNFYGAPVINLTRNTIVRATPAAYIRAEDNCQLHLYNVQLSNLGIAGNSFARGAVNLFNTETIIDKCSICTFPTSPAGINIDTKEASNFFITNNSICNAQYGIVQEKKPLVINPLSQSVIDSNVIINSQYGILTNYTDTITYKNNIVSHSTEDGITINNLTPLSILPITNIKEIDKNIVFANKNGVVIGNVDGSYITNTVCISNRANGLVSNPSTFSTNVSGVSSSHNILAGAVFNGAATGSEANVYNINTHHNEYIGLLLNNIYSTVSAVSSTFNKQQPVYINNCNKGILYLSNVYANNNNKSVVYNYSDQNGFNFFPTYLTTGIIDTAILEPTCLTLLNTKCEKFAVHDVIFNSTGPNITLTPTSNNFIEGSYIFSDCVFSATPFDDLSAKYQTDIYSEAGFVSMHHNKSFDKHIRYTPAGIIQSDTTEFVNSIFPISEKLTPQSPTLKLKSSKKVILIDNFDSNVPPTLIPEFLYVSVWVKKDSMWGSNDNPRLVVASNPTLKIGSDTIIDSQTATTTDWIQLTSTVPVASAVDSRGAVEMYVDCSGVSGGSIYVDRWAFTVSRTS